MNPVKLKVLGEIIDYLTEKQGGNLKSMLDQSKEPMVEEVDVDVMPEGEGMMDEQAMEAGSDLGGEVPEIEATPEGEVEEMAMGEMGDKGPGEELTDEELEALLSQLT